MKTLYTLLLTTTLTSLAHGQSVHLPAGNINARLNPDGAFFHIGETQGAGFEAPAQSGINAIYSSALWLGGIDLGGSLRIAALRYCEASDGVPCDYTPGPLSGDGSGTPSEALVEQYGGVSLVTANMIAVSEFYWDCLNDPGCNINTTFPDGYEIPPGFYTWPAYASSDLNSGEDLAPYFDYNADGIYNPDDGDRPQICGDIAAYTIYNDNTNVHGESLGEPIGLEVQAMMYAYLNGGQALDNTVFLKLKLINRGPHTLNDTYAGMWADVDLGNSNNDYLGSDVERSMWYGYNGTATDPSGPFAAGYGDDLAMVGIRTLAGVTANADGADGDALPAPYSTYGDRTTGWGDGIPDNERLGMSTFIYQNNSGQGAPFPTTDPVNAIGYYNAMKAIWLDGSALTVGGLGYNPTLGTPTKYAFFGESDPLLWGTNGVEPTVANWTEATAVNIPGDRRGLSASGPFTFAPGDVQYVDYAFIFARESQNPEEDVLTTLRTYADEVVNFNCENLPDVVVSTEDESITQISLSLFPNPTESTLTIALSKAATGKYTILDLTGRKVLEGAIRSPNTKIDLTRLTQGVYVINVETPALRATRKLLKVD